MGAKWFGGVTLVAIVASAVACNAILGVQDLPPGSGSIKNTPDGGTVIKGTVPFVPVNGWAEDSCSGTEYIAVEVSECLNITCDTAYALCVDGVYAECACDIPAGWTEVGYSGPGSLVSGSDEGGFFEAGFGDEGFTTFEGGDFDAGFFDAGFFDDAGGGGLLEGGGVVGDDL